MRPRLELLEDRTLLNAYLVTSTGDTLNGSGLPTTGTLRWAIEQANLNPGSTITFDPTVFPASGSTSIALSLGELEIDASMTITGPAGPNALTINGTGPTPPTQPPGTGSSRVFNIETANAIVSIAGMTITGGNASVTQSSVPGNQGGDIFNSGNLTLTNDVVSDGVSAGIVGGPVGRGGGIINEAASNSSPGAVLVLNNVIVEGNKAEGIGGGTSGLGAGGGVWNSANSSLTVMGGSQFLSNQAIGWSSPNAPLYGFNAADAGPGQGGGIWNKGKLNLVGTNVLPLTFTDNQAIGGRAGNGGHGFTPPTTGPGTPGGDGGAGGNAQGGGVFNTGSAFTLNYVNFNGNEANGGRGGDGAGGGNAKGNKGWSGGSGGAAGNGGFAQGGAIYNGVASLNVPNSNFSVDSTGLGNEANGGIGGNGGLGGNGTTGTKRGGNGGTGGNSGAGGLAQGGALANFGGSLSFGLTDFNASEANGGAGGIAGNGGNGGPGSGALIIGGNGAPGGVATAAVGGLAEGGAVYNQTGNLAFTSDPFFASEANGGNGGIGGDGGTGGHGGNGTPGGKGGLGGLGGGGGNGGAAQGGGFYNIVGTVTINSSSFVSDSAGVANHAASGNGGNGGKGGNGGAGGNSGNGRGGDGGAAGAAGNAADSGQAEGGAGGNEGSHVTVTSSFFTSSFAQSGFGGKGGAGGTGGNGGNGVVVPADGFGGAGGNAGNGGNGSIAFGGALAVTASDLTVSNSTIGQVSLGNQVIGGAGGVGGLGGTVGQFGNPGGYYPGSPMDPLPTGVESAGNGGNGGIGATVYGGAISLSQSAQAITINNTNLINNAVTSGAGGAGGPGGLFSFNGTNNGFNGNGGNGGAAIGGTVSLASTTAQNAIFSNDVINFSSATAGAGGAGQINFGINPTTGNPILATAGNGFGSSGGIGGSVQGVNIASVNYNVDIASSTMSNGTGTAGVGGVGGSGGSVLVPFSWAGGPGNNGGTVQGGAVFFSNSLPGTTLNFFINGSSATNNHLSAGAGGAGGNAGASTTVSKKSNVTGGKGGNGGNAQGGGLYVLTGGKSVTITALASDNFINDTVTAGIGGIGGAGFNSVGGTGGDAAGGAIYNNSTNSAKPSTLNLNAVTMAADVAAAGDGGRAGSGTTNNGGAGGPGGNGGNAFGGAIFNGNNTGLSVVNSTLGGNGSNANVLVGGLGARGGNAGNPNTPGNNGGPGGNGGSIAGGNVYVSNSSDSASFVNDTIAYGQAASYGGGGIGGGGSGTGQVGPNGANGTGVGGGYFAGSGSSNTIGNSIIALNIAAADSDVAGAFISMGGAGHNVIGDPTGSTGFSAASGDRIGVTAPQLNLGPLQNNGGPALGAPGATTPTFTEALLNGSVAVGTGNNALVPVGITTDQRGPGFARVTFGTVDAGAYQVQLPPSPPSPPPPPPPPPGPPGPPVPPAPPAGSKNLGTITTIVGIDNTYPGFVQESTVTADVVNVNGYNVDEGIVTLQLNGQTIYAPVHNGVASATFATGLFDFGAIFELLFPHPLTASYSDSTGLFAPSGTGVTVQAIWFDFFFSLLTAQLRSLTQLQTP